MNNNSETKTTYTVQHEVGAYDTKFVLKNQQAMFVVEREFKDGELAHAWLHYFPTDHDARRFVENKRNEINR